MSTSTHRWLAPLLLLSAVVGCPPTAPTPVTGTAWTFPHPDGFVAGAAHATPWFDSPGGCNTCHLDPPAGTHVRGCRDCHEGFPHADGYDDPAAHGPHGADDGASCRECHGTGARRPADREQSACRDCHADYPHRPTWVLPALHGAPVIAGGLEVCGGCHGEAGAGGAIAQACADCHPLFPHADGYRQPELHGAVVATQGVDSCATHCHGVDFGGGGSGRSCAECHEPYPHGDDYRGLAHRDAVEALGEQACLGCHDGGAGFPADFSCADSCHAG